MMLAILITVFSGIMIALIGILITVMGITIPVISFLPAWVVISISCILIPIGVFI